MEGISRRRQTSIFPHPPQFLKKKIKIEKGEGTLPNVNTEVEIM
jgi:hypothetical protein